MRFFITVNFVLLGVCLALSQGQEALKSRGEVQVPSSLIARADAAPLNGAATSTDGQAKLNGDSHHPPQLTTVKDPKLCAIIVKRMKEFETMTKNGGLPSLKTGPAPPSGSSSSPKPLASGVTRRSKLAQRTDIGSINRRDSSGNKDAPASSTTDPNACKEMETMLKAAKEKMQADMKKGMPAPQPDGAKKDSTPKTSSTDATPKTSPTDAKPSKSPTGAKPKSGSTETKTNPTDATPKTGSTDADS
ncbi:uncharacterized protein MELLADRAFT_111618 [Melampsora larici-populina 98AG31]|uniref:Secreted protein n=1 Tax=Melampsora larici-populina (strain 98AG31 / pathotype 3-4-7) TaxID=747676 RepID=F4S3S8_MELLP|nr:uncharacterized protein MELLADRAFT_111618 [Melampsora larici-populina 98AG31]EGG00744.1 secreted protein [Melampsora larici-populina 98AG31]